MRASQRPRAASRLDPEEKNHTSPTLASPKRLSVALVASDQEWSSRSLETILGPAGYVVIRAYTGAAALAQARRRHPDIILLDAHLPDWDGFALCLALREDPQMGIATPIMMLAAGPPTKQRRLAALRAGAWDVLSLPLDGEELLLKLEAYVRARVETDRVVEEGLVDHATGLYNARGLARRARELSSDALRHHTPIACVVFGADLDRENVVDEVRVSEDIAGVLQRAGRVSDAIGRLGRADFAVIAPGTNAAAALRLAERMLGALQQAPHADLHHHRRMRVGYEAVENLHATPVEPVDLLVRATAALEHARAEGNGERIRRYAQPAVHG